MKKESCVLMGMAVGIIVFSTSCSKERTVTTDTSTDYFTAEEASNDLLRQSSDAVTANQVDKSWRTQPQQSFQLTGGCATVTVIPDSVSGWFPVTYIIDFGTTNCQGADGKYRRGKIKVILTGKYRDPGTIIKIIPDGYYVNDKKVEGTLPDGEAKKLENKGLNSSGNIYFNVTEGIKITRPDGKIVTWKSSRVREWVAGYPTITPFDDEYDITGNGEGENKNGVHFTVTITKAIHVKVGCPWPVSGTLEIEPDGYKKRTLDFGNGNCDNEATLTIGNKTIKISI